MAFFDFLTGGSKADGDSNGSLFTRLKDSNGNDIAVRHRKKINTDTQGSLLVAGKNDSLSTILRTDRKGNLIMGNYVPELLENFEGTVLNAQKWTAASTTFVPAQTTAGGYNFNNTNLTTANAVTNIISTRHFYKHQRIPLQLKVRIRANINTNSNADFGFGIPSGTTLINANGISVRIINGLWYAVITYNNTEVSVPRALLMSDGVTQFSTANTNAEYYVVDIIADDDNVVITVQDTFTGNLVAAADLPVPISSVAMWGATALPVYFRLFNSSVAPSVSATLNISTVQVLSTDWNVQPDSSQIAGSLHYSSGRNPYTGAQLENHTNSTPPVSATLSNTAAGYTTLGGKWQFAAVTGASTDYAIFGFQVPIGSRFICEGVHIETYNTGAAVATTPTILEWSAGFNSSAVSLATANIIRKQLGIQSFAIGAAIGSTAAPIDINFITPEVVESGRFLHIILNMPIGTATTSQIIRGICTIKGRFI